MPFRTDRHASAFSFNLTRPSLGNSACIRARASAIIATAILASALIAYGKDETKKLSTYDMIVVEPVAVTSGAAKNFPPGLDSAIRARMCEELKKKKLFRDVLDLSAPTQQKAPDSGGAVDIADATSTASASGAPTGNTTSKGQADGQETGPHKIILSTTVEQFSKGNTAARVLVGFGAGESKITLHFVLRDSATGAQLLQMEQKASWSGMTSFSGGDANDATRGVTNNAVKGLVREIEKNR